MRKIQKKNLIPVFPGDLVRFLFWHLPAEKQDVEAEVLEVTQRYGRVSGGNIFQSPLLKYRLMDGKEDFADAGFVVRVLKRSSRPSVLPNVCAPWRAKEHLYKTRNRRGMLCGPIAELAMLCLSKVPFFVPHHVDPRKVANLFEKQRRPGLIREKHSIILVHKKQFGRWVRQNASKICATSRELDRRNTARNQAFEDDYWISVREDIEREWDNLY